MAARQPQLGWARQAFRPGERVAVAVSGGADSVALLVAMAASRAETGLVVSAVHVHHGLRGAEADGDAQFVADLAKVLEVPLRTRHGDVALLAAKRGQGIEEAARALRYRVFHELLAAHDVDAVATAHTLDDQAETVLLKMLRGAWTEGLGGIAPVVASAGGGRIVRPLLAVTRAEIIGYLEARAQPWREDTTNQELTFTRNRVRYTLLPQLREFQPRIAEHLSRMAAVARDEEAWWALELARVLPGMVLPGKPVRGGGRANSTRPGEGGVAMELERLRALHPALQRRVLRAAAEQLGAAITFDQTEALRELTETRERGAGKRGRIELGGGLAAERTPRELHLVRTNEPALHPASGTSGAGTRHARGCGIWLPRGYNWRFAHRSHACAAYPASRRPGPAATQRGSEDGERGAGAARPVRSGAQRLPGARDGKQHPMDEGSGNRSYAGPRTGGRTITGTELGTRKYFEPT